MGATLGYPDGRDATGTTPLISCYTNAATS
jgi:hypothetical protein